MGIFDDMHINHFGDWYEVSRQNQQDGDNSHGDSSHGDSSHGDNSQGDSQQEVVVVPMVPLLPLTVGSVT